MFFYQKFSLTLFTTALLAFGGFCDSLVAEENAQAPPNIEHYGLLPQYREVTLSPDGKHLALIQRQGTQDFFVVKNAASLEIVGGFNAAKYNARSIYFLTNRHIIILTSKHTRMMRVRGSFEKSSAFVYDLESKKIKVLLAKTKGLYPAQGYGNIVGFNADTQELYMPAYSGGLGGTPRLDLYKVKLKNGKGKIHAKGNRSTIDWFVDKDGKILAREDFDNKANKHKVFSKISGKWNLIYSHETNIPDINVQAVSSDGTNLLFISGTAIFSMSLSDGTIQGPVYHREDTDVGYIMTDINQKLILVKYSGFTPSYDFSNVADNDTFAMLSSYFPSSSVHYIDSTSNENKWLIQVSGNGGAGAYKIYNRGKNQLQNLVSQYPEIQSIGELKAVKFKARDGMKIPSIITLPVDPKKRQNLPLIALPHGGPEAHDSIGFDWLAQYLSAKGYAVLQPNFRGSNGFGNALRDSGHGEWGQKMQDDVSDGVAALVKAGYVDPQRVCIMGASYGGYSALAGGAFSPELYRCVISIAGVSDLPRMLKSAKFKFGSNHWVVDYWKKIIGDSDKEREKLKSISPINSVDKFKAPVLLVHGKDDTVVPIRQSSLMHKALKRAGKDVEFITLKGEDHWLSGSETRLALIKAIDEFLDTHNPAF